MKNKTKSNFIKSSNLLFLTGGVMISFYLTSLMIFKNEANSLGLVLINLGIIGVVGLIIRQGVEWARFTGLLLLGLYLVEASSMTMRSNINFVVLMFFMAQMALVLWSTLILFVKFHGRNKAL